MGGPLGALWNGLTPGFFPPVGLKSSHHQKCIQGIVGLAPQTTQPNNLYCPKNEHGRVWVRRQEMQTLPTGQAL